MGMENSAVLVTQEQSCIDVKTGKIELTMRLKILY